MMNRLKIIQFICSLFPPIVAQQLRAKLISIETAENMAKPFKRKAFTGSVFSGNTNDFHAFKFFIHGYFDWRNIVLTKTILKRKAGDIVEVGANIGTETISFADINPENQVHAFEPVPFNFESLERIQSENQLSQLRLYNVLVSDKPGTAFFNVPQANNSGSGHISNQIEEHSREFKVVTIDEELAQMKACSSIVIDVEGFEYQVLEGARRTIETQRPYLILEVNARYLELRANISVLFFYEEIIKLKYTPYYIGKMGLHKVDIADFKTKANKNWICIPNEELDRKKALSRSIFWNALNPFLHLKVV